MFELAFDHQLGDFNVWRELATPRDTGGGAVNFLTGAGAFLQSFLFGYLGLAPRANGLDINPVLPVHAPNVTVTGLWYAGCSCNVFYTHATMVFQCATAGRLQVTTPGSSADGAAVASVKGGKSGNGMARMQANSVHPLGPTPLASQSHIVDQTGATSGFEMCFAIGSHTFGAGSQRKHVSNQAQKGCNRIVL